MSRKHETPHASRPAGPKRGDRRLRQRILARIKRAIQGRFVVRFHMFLILLAVVASGALLSKLLLALGLEGLALRWGLAVAGSYGVFFACVRLWIAYVRAQLAARSTGPSGDGGGAVADFAADLADGALRLHDAGGGSAAPGPGVVSLPAEAPLDGSLDLGDAAASAGRSSGDGGFLDKLLDGAGDGDGEGIVVLVVLIALVAVIVGVSAFLIVQAPLILTEAGAQVLLAEALRRRAKQVEAPGWAAHVFRKTAVPALIVLVIAVAAGALIAAICPGARTVAEALRYGSA